MGQPHLTPREWAVLALVADGLLNKEIAKRLVVAKRTVNNHLWRLYPKLGVRNRVEAAAWFRAHQPAQTD